MSEERRERLSERDIELIEAVLERTHRGCPDLTEEQCAALPEMIAAWKEEVETKRLEREFWQSVKLRGSLYGLLTLGAFLFLSILFGGREALAKLVHYAASHAGG